MAGESLQVADGLAALGEQTKARVPEIVEPDRGETGPLKQRLEVPIDHVLRFKGRPLQGRPLVRGEYEP